MHPLLQVNERIMLGASYALVAILFNLLIIPSVAAENLKDNGLPSLEMPHYQFPLVSTGEVSLDDSRDENSRFNTLWIQQQQEGYQVREGGAAIGRMLQMSAKVLYKSFRDNGHISSDMPDENGDGNYSVMKYKVRLHADTLKFGLEYRF